MVCPGIGSGRKRYADLAVSLEAADPRTMAGARINDNEGTLRRVDIDVLGGNDSYQTIINWPLERAAVNDQLKIIIEHVRCSLSQVFAKLVSALAHRVPEQGAALRRIDTIVVGRPV